jgi:hypothetical protein
MSFTDLEKTNMVLINCEAYGHSELAWQIYGEKFLPRILTNARTFVNVVQHLRDFGRFEMNKRDLSRQGDGRPFEPFLSNFFEVSFYDAFTHNYSLFTLLFKPLWFLSSLYKFYQRFMIKLKNI